MQRLLLHCISIILYPDICKRCVSIYSKPLYPKAIKERCRCFKYIDNWLIIVLSWIPIILTLFPDFAENWSLSCFSKLSNINIILIYDFNILDSYEFIEGPFSYCDAGIQWEFSSLIKSNGHIFIKILFNEHQLKLNFLSYFLAIRIWKSNICHYRWIAISLAVVIFRVGIYILKCEIKCLFKIREITIVRISIIWKLSYCCINLMASCNVFKSIINKNNSTGPRFFKGFIFIRTIEIVHLEYHSSK